MRSRDIFLHWQNLPLPPSGGDKQPEMHRQKTPKHLFRAASALSTFKVGVELYLYDGLEVRRTRKLSLDRALVSFATGELSGLRLS